MVIKFKDSKELLKTQIIEINLRRKLNVIKV